MVDYSAHVYFFVTVNRGFGLHPKSSKDEKW